MFHIAFGDVGNRFYAAVRMPWKAFQVMRGGVGAKIVEHQKWVESWRLAITEDTIQVNPGPFHCRLAG
jgi:hypothetical protein